MASKKGRWPDNSDVTVANPLLGEYPGKICR